VTEGQEPPRGDWSQNVQRAALGIIVALFVSIIVGAVALRDTSIKNTDDIAGLKSGLDRVEKRATEQINAVLLEHKNDAQRLEERFDKIENELSAFREWKSGKE